MLNGTLNSVCMCVFFLGGGGSFCAAVYVVVLCITSKLGLSLSVLNLFMCLLIAC
jgi:hypothetical protein